MKNLTLSEKIVSAVIILMIFVLGVYRLNTLTLKNAINAVWILPILTISIVFIILLIGKIDELREQIIDAQRHNPMIITKFEAHELTLENPEDRIMMCNKPVRDEIHCKGCPHYPPHVHTKQCIVNGCETIIRIQR